MDEFEELSIQGTASEALVSKTSAARLKYFNDDFLPIFCKRKERKPPLINRGYFARVQCVRMVVNKFLELTSNETCRQLLVLGGGYDTTSLNLLKEDGDGDNGGSNSNNLNCYEGK